MYETEAASNPAVSDSLLDSSVDYALRTISAVRDTSDNLALKFIPTPMNGGGTFLTEAPKPEPLQESELPDCLAHRLLVEFGKTRTNYNSLVPRIIEVMRLYRDYGPGRCPVPVVANLDDILNDDSLMRIEHRYPTSMEAGFLVLCTERRALRSGGGGKYYFMDHEDRLVGCHKSDLPGHVDNGNLKSGPVLLKNLIFVFIMRGAYGLDPRCKSSNPQRLLEFYETLCKEGKAEDVQRLVRVWSMEVHAEPPYDDGFPHCTLLWIKRMNIAAHINKWRCSQWHTCHMKAQTLYASETLGNGRYFAAGDAVSAGRTKRRKTVNPRYAGYISYDYSQNGGAYEDIMATGDGDLDRLRASAPTYRAADLPWDAASVNSMYQTFAEIAPVLNRADVVDWAYHILERLSVPVLRAAVHLLSQSLSSSHPATDSSDAKLLTRGILQMIYSLKDMNQLTESLRVLLACLVQQQRLDESCTSPPTAASSTDDHTLVNVLSSGIDKSLDAAVQDMAANLLCSVPYNQQLLATGPTWQQHQQLITPAEAARTIVQGLIWSGEPAQGDSSQIPDLDQGPSQLDQEQQQPPTVIFSEPVRAENDGSPCCQEVEIDHEGSSSVVKGDVVAAATLSVIVTSPTEGKNTPRPPSIGSPSTRANSSIGSNLPPEAVSSL